MFPIVAVEVRGLDPDKMYTIELSFEQIDAHRWRYVTGQWQPGLKPDAAINRIPYQHPDSPNYGRKWMKDPISFSKVKLTNKVDRADASHVSGFVLDGKIDNHRCLCSSLDPTQLSS